MSRPASLFVCRVSRHALGADSGPPFAARDRHDRKQGMSRFVTSGSHSDALIKPTSFENSNLWLTPVSSRIGGKLLAWYFIVNGNYGFCLPIPRRTCCVRVYIHALLRCERINELFARYVSHTSYKAFPWPQTTIVKYYPALKPPLPFARHKNVDFLLCTMRDSLPASRIRVFV